MIKREFPDGWYKKILIFSFLIFCACGCPEGQHEKMCMNCKGTGYEHEWQGLEQVQTNKKCGSCGGDGKLCVKDLD